MRRRKLLVGVAVLVAIAVGLYVYARDVLASDFVRTALEQQLSAGLGQPVRIGTATVSIFPRLALDLNAVEIGAPVAVQLGRIRIVTGLRPLLSRIVHDAEVVVSDGQIRLPLPFPLVPAASGAAGSGAGSALTITSIRSIDLRAISLIGGGETWVLDAACAVDGDRLEIHRLAARAGTTRLEAAGRLASIAGLEGTLDATANPLDLDELMAFGSALTTTAVKSAPAATAAPAAMHLVVNLAAPAGRFGTYQFSDLSTAIDVAPGGVALSSLSVAAFGGTFRGRLDTDTRRPVPDLRLKGRVDGLDVAEVMKAAGSAGGITGKLGGEISLAASGTDSMALVRTARGSIAAAITDGTMARLDMVRTIVLAFGQPDGAPPEGSGSAFTRLSGTFTLANSTVASERVTLASRDFDMSGRGTVQMLTGALSARGDVVLSEALTAQSGRDLRRYAQEDGRVVVPATIGGTLQQPRVSLDIAAATRRALGNELERRAKSFLGDLFRRKKQ